jgi:hypothetical protein
MKLTGGNWSRGDFFAACTLALGVGAIIVTVATPELRLAVGLESSVTGKTSPPTEKTDPIGAPDTAPPSKHTMREMSSRPASKTAVQGKSPEPHQETEQVETAKRGADAIPALQPIKDTYQRVFSNGFLFELKSCVLRGRDLSCYFTVTNDSDSDRGFSLMIYWGDEASRIFDESGDVYISQRGQLGSELGTPDISGLSNTLVPSVKVKAMLQFEGVHPDVGTARLLRVGFHNSADPILRMSHADFVDVPIQNR